ncbi:MAG: DUF309 domain-containing protein [Sulfuricurvum sp.]|uniref:DUF309 domain-containing protein n=1 Tax=Sulfuricurvum sp. TaxID=2025608 RepID=UPI0027345CB7|nr:DUF309 domain-containing protein [Sulfuricurvum sp.]MDP2850058.1 DUF309 domain-containing protein [Sulfuricurvum sp.]
MAQKLEGITEALEAFVRSLEEGRYYDAHEDVEAIWYPRRFEANDEVLLWKGFINAAVSFELINRGKAKPAQIAWQTYLKYRILLENLITPHKELYVKIEALIHTRRLECQNF